MDVQKSSKMPSSVKERKVTLPYSSAKAMVADFASEVAVIVTHPWGPLGGNMNNNVVLAIVVWFQQLKITTMRFDFGGSQIGRGDRQVAQVKEAADFLLEGSHLEVSQHQSTTHKNSKPPKHVLLVGYSYGSIISASAAIKIPQCIGVAMLSPPLAVRHWLYLFHGNYHLEQARKSGRPLLMIIGSRDNFTAEGAFMDVVESMPTSTTTGAVLKDADHFFRGREQDLMDVMGHWLLNVFPQCRGDL
jgi:alpha/beta superfamily hydrolase